MQIIRLDSFPLIDSFLDYQHLRWTSRNLILWLQLLLFNYFVLIHFFIHAGRTSQLCLLFISKITRIVSKRHHSQYKLQSDVLSMRNSWIWYLLAKPVQSCTILNLSPQFSHSLQMLLCELVFPLVAAKWYCLQATLSPDVTIAFSMINSLECAFISDRVCPSFLSIRDYYLLSSSAIWLLLAKPKSLRSLTSGWKKCRT